ncbi:hypothetical protein [Bradyrhizobium sp.]|jgi:hypothetical protein|uniref:hypothetical protein n=1 Tax=Bradyrhizobium sp. TaxID=376 RepID=UPI003D11C12E
MPAPLAYSAVSQNARRSSISSFECSVVAFVAAIMLFMIGFALVDPRHGGSDSAANASLFSSRDFSSGVPIL